MISCLWYLFFESFKKWDFRYLSDTSQKYQTLGKNYAVTFSVTQLKYLLHCQAIQGGGLCSVYVMVCVYFLERLYLT